MRKIYHIRQKPVFANDPNTPESKICPICEDDKPLAEFSQRENGRYEVRCKDCVRAADRERNHRRRPLKRGPKIQEIAKAPKLAAKECLVCKEVKTLSAFDWSSTTPDKRTPDCTDCRERRKKIVQPSLFFKICPDCGVEKSLEAEFGKTANGYRTNCKQCDSKNSMQWHKDHPERVRMRIQKRQSDPKYIEYHRKKEHLRYNTMPEVREKAHATTKVYRQANPLKRREWNSRRDARKRGTKTSRVSFKRILERDGYWCYICEKAIDPNAPKKSLESLVFDHVIPLVPRPNEPQGTHTEDNIRPSHNICNSRKKNKPFHLLTPFDRQGPN